MKRVLLALGVAWSLPAAASPDVTSIAAGGFTCATFADGTVSCWGYNRTGAIDTNTMVNRDRPVQIAGITDAIEVVIVNDHPCVRRANATLTCWGGELPYPAKIGAVKPRRTLPLQGVVQLAGPCQRTASGTVACLRDDDTLAAIAGVTDAIDVTGSAGRGCIVRRSGEVACWLADRVARPIPTVRDATRVAITHPYACALVRPNGSVTCWDWALEPEGKDYPLRGKPPEQLPVKPERVRGFSGGTALVGGFDVCVTTNKAVLCLSEDRVPKLLRGYGAVKALAVSNHTCAWRGGRDVICSGEARYGALGNGWSRARTIPTPVPGITDAVAIEASYSPGSGNDQFTCALRRNHRVACWGNTHPIYSNDYSPTPTDIGLVGVKRLVRDKVVGVIDSKDRWVEMRERPTIRANGIRFASAASDCGRAIDGRVLCDDALMRSEVQIGEFFVIPKLDDAVQIAVGAHTFCARRKTGQVTCQEEGVYRPISPINDAIDLAAGDFKACAVRADHRVWCWGDRDGHVPYGGYIQFGPATEIVGIFATQISMGGSYACALATDKTVWCWGDNSTGQLGDGTVTSRVTPARVPGLERVSQISAGTDHACALVEGGTVTCWGESVSGQVGTYATENIVDPVAVAW